MFGFRRSLLVFWVAALLAVPTYYAADSKDPARAGGNELGVEINRAGTDPLYVPVGRQSPGGYTVLPAPDGADEKTTGVRVFGVKIAPKVDGESVRIEATILSGGFDQPITCEQVKALDHRLAAEYLVGKGESVRVSQFEGIGIPPFEIKVFSARADGGDTRRACCTVGSQTCCLRPGQECVRCGRQLCCL